MLSINWGVYGRDIQVSDGCPVQSQAGFYTFGTGVDVPSGDGRRLIFVQFVLGLAVIAAVMLR